MDTSNGRIISEEKYHMLKELQKDRLVLLEGSEEAVRALGKRVALGAKEEERRRARREQQKESRKRNR